MGKTGVREIQKLKTRERLLKVARELFAAQGILATRTADVAAAAGVSHGTIFVHFPTRDALIEETIEAFGRDVARRTHELAVSGRSLREVLEAHLAGLSEHEGFYGRLVAEGPLLPDAARNALIDIQSAVSWHVAEAAEREGARIRQVPMHLLFNTWVALLHYYLVNRDLFAPGGSVLARCGGELLDHMIGMLRGGGRSADRARGIDGPGAKPAARRGGSR